MLLGAAGNHVPGCAHQFNAPLQSSSISQPSSRWNHDISESAHAKLLWDLNLWRCGPQLSWAPVLDVPKRVQ